MSERISIEIESGAIEVDVRIDGEDVGVIKFNPSDFDIARRYENVVDHIEKIEISDDFTKEEFFELSDKIKDMYDYLLNYKVSDQIFSKCNPFTVTKSGDFYFENVLVGIAGVIEKVTSQRIAKKNAKIKRATAKYTKDHLKKAK